MGSLAGAFTGQSSTQILVTGQDEHMLSPAGIRDSNSPNYRSIHALAKERGTIIISPNTVAQE